MELSELVERMERWRRDVRGDYPEGSYERVDRKYRYYDPHSDWYLSRYIKVAPFSPARRDELIKAMDDSALFNDNIGLYRDFLSITSAHATTWEELRRTREIVQRDDPAVRERLKFISPEERNFVPLMFGRLLEHISDQYERNRQDAHLSFLIDADRMELIYTTAGSADRDGLLKRLVARRALKNNFLSAALYFNAAAHMMEFSVARAAVEGLAPHYPEKKWIELGRRISGCEGVLPYARMLRVGKDRLSVYMEPLSEPRPAKVAFFDDRGQPRPYSAAHLTPNLTEEIGIETRISLYGPAAQGLVEFMRPLNETGTALAISPGHGIAMAVGGSAAALHSLGIAENQTILLFAGGPKAQAALAGASAILMGRSAVR